MSLAWMTRVWASAEPSEAADRLMLLALADNANDAGVCWPSVPTLARKCAVKKRAALDTLARLEAAGYVVVERSTGRHNTYRLLAVRAVPGGAADRTGAGERTGVAGRTGAANDTGGSAADRTGAVQRAAPKPSRTLTGSSSTAGGRGRSMASRSSSGVADAAARHETDGVPEAASGPAGEAVEALARRGVDAGAALRLVREYGAERVGDVVERFDREPGHGPGWLVAALRDGYRTDASDAGGNGVACGVPEAPRPLYVWGQVEQACRREGVTMDAAFERVPDGPDGHPRWRRRVAGSAAFAEPTKGGSRRSA